MQDFKSGIPGEIPGGIPPRFILISNYNLWNCESTCIHHVHFFFIVVQSCVVTLIHSQNSNLACVFWYISCQGISVRTLYKFRLIWAKLLAPLYRDSKPLTCRHAGPELPLSGPWLSQARMCPEVASIRGFQIYQFYSADCLIQHHKWPLFTLPRLHNTHR